MIEFFRGCGRKRDFVTLMTLHFGKEYSFKIKAVFVTIVAIRVVVDFHSRMLAFRGAGVEPPRRS